MRRLSYIAVPVLLAVSIHAQSQQQVIYNNGTPTITAILPITCTNGMNFDGSTFSCAPTSAGPGTPTACTGSNFVSGFTLASGTAPVSTCTAVPTLNQNTSGTAAGLSAVLVAASGGMGADLSAAAAGKYPKSSGATPAVFSASTLAAAGVGSPTGCTGSNFVTAFTLNADAAPTSTCTAVPTLNQNTSGTAAGLSAQLAIGGVGSAGLSGTSPVTISAAGAIACATCVTTASGQVLNQPTIGISGTSGSTHVNNIGTAPTCAFTSGGGTSPSCALDTGSTDRLGKMTLTTGSGSPGSTGSITLTFNSSLGTNMAVCFIQLGSGSTAWSVNSSATQTTYSKTAPVFSWSSNSATAAVALTASTNYKMAYLCEGI